jgi:hypothetical protein
MTITVSIGLSSGKEVLLRLEDTPAEILHRFEHSSPDFLSFSQEDGSEVIIHRAQVTSIIVRRIQ